MFRQIKAFSLILGLVIALAACGGAKKTSTETASDAQTTSATEIPSATPVGLATAYQNLLDQQSFVLTAKLSKLNGSLAKLPGITDPTTIKIEHAGNDRHIQVIISTGRTLFELWRVNNQLYVNIGLGTTKTSENDPIVKQFVPLLDADSQIVNALAADNATYTVTGTAKVNGVQSNVEQSEYDLSQVGGSIFSFGSSSTVDAKIWVAQSGRYLVKANLKLSGALSGTAVAGTETESSGATVDIDITDAGKLKGIDAPI
ncbi:MAG TPA: hypothetical protein VHV31_10745 [Nitrolancea sp.]|nr:hypothetical protein [Nitrolancea sp.]